MRSPSRSVTVMRLLSALSLFPPSFFGRANRGLLTEATATLARGIPF
jgi:hypothetical protein